jgi:peptide/nickel transport system permease protein
MIPWVRWWSRSRSTVVGMTITLFLIVVAVLAPVLSPFDPIEQDLYAVNQPPSGTHWLGTDQLGRDTLSRIVWGARFSLSVSLSAVALGGTIGLVLGICAGYFRGVVDGVLMRVVDVLLAFPMYMVAIFIMAVLDPSPANTVIAIGIGSSPRFARLARAEVLRQREASYVEAAQAGGATDLRIMARHILPNVVSPVLVMFSLIVGTAILVEASLSFLGLGVSAPTPAWGLMVNEGLVGIRSAAWVSILPGLAITLAVLGVNLLGDGLRDLLDPRVSQDG